jgi:4-hydroxybenzoate polyprenyltransferase
MALLAFTAFALAGHDSTGVLTGALLLAWVAFFTGFGGIYLFNAFRYREASE